MESTMTFAAVAEKWMDAKQRVVKRSTFCAYNLLVRIHLQPAFGSHVSIKEREVQEFVLGKLASGLGRKTVKDMLAVLKTIVRFGVKYHDFPDADWDIVFPTDTYARPLPVLSVDNHRKLLRYLLGCPSSQNIGVLLALCTGMRIGEVCALRWRDVDMVHRTITVSHTLCRVYDVEKRCTDRVLGSPKTKTSNREIPVGKELYSALRSVRELAGKDSFVVGGGPVAKEPRTYRDYYGRLLDRIGLPHMVFHGLRHTFATRCIECGCDYKTVSVILGHSNVATTMNLYVHPDRNQKKRCVERLSKFIGEL